MSTYKNHKKRARVEETTFHQVSALDEYRVKDMPDSDVYYMPTFISSAIADEWYQQLLQLDTWYQPKLKMYGREILQSRKIAAYSTDPELDLKYSGQAVNMIYEYPQVLKDIQEQVELRLGVKFNHVMLNLYENGTVHIGNHRDNLENKVIASVSLGATRKFIMTHDSKDKRTSTKSSNAKASNSEPKSKKRKVAYEPDESDRELVAQKSWLLASGSLFVMQGDTQKYWKHAIPKYIFRDLYGYHMPQQSSF